MIKILTNADIEKLKFLDKVFSSITLEEFQQRLGADVVVDKLRGESANHGILEDLYYSNHHMHTDIQDLKTRISTLESKLATMTTLQTDLNTVIRTVSTLLPNQNILADFNSMKGRYGIYQY